MLDLKILNAINPARNLLARPLARAGVKAKHVSWAGAGCGVAAGLSAALQFYTAALVFILLSRICDGMDGPIARAGKPEPAGAFLDAIADLIFYLSVVVGFALARPENLLPAFMLISSFYLTGGSFFAQAAVQAHSGKRDTNKKGLFYDSALMEGAETIGFFLLFCLMPEYFPYLALLFAAICLVSFGLRVYQTLRRI